MSIVGLRIKNLRDEKRITQDELGSILDLSQQQVSSIENGTREPSLDKLVAICKYFNVSLDYIVGLSLEKSIQTDIDDEIKRLLLKYMSLGKRNRTLLSGIIDLITESETLKQ